MFFRTFVLANAGVLALALGAEAAPLKTLDLSRDLKDRSVNVFEADDYREGAVILVPAPRTREDRYIISLEEQGAAACTVTGVRSRKLDDGKIAFYFLLRIQDLEPGSAACELTIHQFNRDAKRRQTLRFHGGRG